MVAIGVCDLYRGIKLGEYRENETKLTSNGIVMILLGLILAIIELLLAIILLVEPQVSVKHHVVILGAELIWHGVHIIRNMNKRRPM